MQQQPKPHERIVTPQEYAKGYLELNGTIATSRRYQLIRRLPDGNYLVREPQKKPS